MNITFKKVAAAVSAFCLVFVQMPAAGILPSPEKNIVASAASQADAITYKLLGNSVEIIGCTTSEAEVTIPEKIEGLPVTSIGEGAFTECAKLVAVNLPDTITNIGSYAFSGCSRLTFLELPGHVKTIGESAFQQCGLVFVSIPAETVSIGERAFQGCVHLTSFSVDAANQNYAEENGVLYSRDFSELIQYPAAKSDVTCTVSEKTSVIAKAAFYQCISLEKVELPSKMKSIGKEAFSGCSSLKEVVMPDTLETLESYAFYDCGALTSVQLPNGIQRVEDCAFQGCSSLKRVSIPESVSAIEKMVFYQCSSLSQIQLSKNLTKIEEAAFQECRNLTQISFYGQLTSLGARAFYRCEKLSSLILPDSVTSIGEYAFDSCTSLKSVSLGSGLKYIRDWTFSNCENLTYLTLGNKVSYIGVNAFFGNESLNSVSLPETLTVLDNDAFWGCSSLKKIILPKSVISVGSDAFGGCLSLESVKILNPNCAIYDSEYTICNDTGVYTGVITGYDNSTAAAYAAKYHLDFISLGDSPKETTASTRTPLTTTTTTTVTTTTTTSTTSTTETKPTTETTVFQNGVNNWGFKNSSENFKYGYYYLNQDYQKKLEEGLSNTEKIFIQENAENGWRGSCYGMTATSILSCYGIMNMSDYSPDAVCPYNIKMPDDEIISVNNYYTLLQWTDKINSQIKNELYDDSSDSVRKKISYLVSSVEQHIPAMLIIYGREVKAHAIAVYDVQYGDYYADGKKYTGRLLVYDSNQLEYNRNSCLYFNDSDWSWAIPEYHMSNEDYGSRLGFCTSSLSLINYHGYFPDGSASGFIDLSDYIATMCSAPMETEPQVFEMGIQQGTWYNATAASDKIKRVPVLISADDNKTENENICYIMSESPAGHSFSADMPQNLNVFIKYKNSFLKAEASSGEEIRFAPEGRIEIDGSNTDYSVKMVLDDGMLVTSWDTITVSGSQTDNIQLQKTDNGYLLSASSLNAVSVSASSQNHTAKLTFSADSNSVLLYEIDETTIGIKEDTDGDGIYEKDITESNSFLPGDVTQNGSIDILDVITINQAILGKEKLTAVQIQAADVNHDTVPNSADSLMIMKYIVGLLEKL